MSFVNLTLDQFLFVAAAGAALILLLYLRGKRHHSIEVSSLQFWVPLAEKEEQRGARRIRNVWSLLLQLACFLALLAAIAWPEWKSQSTRVKQHILLIDTSAWTQQDNGHGQILEQEKTLVRRYVNTLPSRDQIMVTTVDSLVVIRTPFTKDRIKIERALSEVRPTLLALDMREVQDFARQSRSPSLTGNPEILYLGPRQTGQADGAATEAAESADGEAFRSYLVDAAPQHCGISRAGLARVDQSESLWQMIVALKNYGTEACHCRLEVALSGRDLPPRDEYLAPGQQAQAEYKFNSTRSELLTMSIAPGDSLAADQHVKLLLPGLVPTRIALYTYRPEEFRSLVEVVPNASVSLRKPEDYQSSPRDIDLMILDRLSPAAAPKIPVLWVTPPGENSSFALSREVAHPTAFQWNGEVTPARGLYAQDLPVPVADVYQLSAGDTPVLSVPAGPVVVVRSGGTPAQRSAVLGFDPTSEKVRYQVTTPLLWMNLVQWLTANTLAPARIEVGAAGDAVIQPEQGISPGDIGIRSQAANPPLIFSNTRAQFFAAQPAAVRYMDQGTEEERHLILPQLAVSSWSHANRRQDDSLSLNQAQFPQFESWRWLVLLGLAIACVEWHVFGGQRLYRKVGAGREG